MYKLPDIKFSRPLVNPTCSESRKTEKTATVEDFFTDEDEDDDEDESDDDDAHTTAHRKDTMYSVASTKKRLKKKKKKKHGSVDAVAELDLTASEFRTKGKELIDFIADYLEATREKQPHTDVMEGFLFKKLYNSIPQNAGKMDEVLKDLNKFILPGVPQWQSPKHHHLMPTGGSYASLLGSMLCDGLGCVGMTWADCPAITELEMVVMNWLAQLMDLPPKFHFLKKTSDAEGGGILQSSTTECLLAIIVAAKRKAMGFHVTSDITEGMVTDKLVAYCSEQAHPSLERIAEVVGIKLKRLWTDKKGVMHSTTLRTSIQDDIKKGYIPFVVIVTLGTIGTAAIDQLNKIGPYVASLNKNIWVHVEASYAGGSFICREYQPLLHGIEYADSLSMAAHKWLPIHMDCACLWVKDVPALTFTFGCEDPDGPLTIPVDIKATMADYRHWSLPMTRRFRAIKLWVVFKLYGAKGLQVKIREDVRRAKELEKLINEDHRFETMPDLMFAMVPFRVKRPNNNDINREILREINKHKLLKISGTTVSNKFWMRCVINGKQTTNKDVKISWEQIQRVANFVLEDFKQHQQNEGYCGRPNYKYVNKIGVNERMDNLLP